jgi:hypothetical protein
MTRRRYIPYLVAIVLLIGMALPLIIRGSARYRALQKALNFPDAVRRASMVPQKQVFPTTEPIKIVDIGYATFDIGSSRPVTIEAQGSDGTLLTVANDQLRMFILPPFASPQAHNVPSPLRLEQEVEETQPLSLPTVIWMSRDKFLAYAMNLSNKAGCKRGSAKVIFFTTAHARGIVRIGDDPQDRLRAHVALASLDGDVNAGFHLYLTNGGSEDIEKLLERLVGSFQFSIDSVAGRDQIKNLITRRNIPRKSN